MSPQKITILGSTGSIGVNTLDVIARHPARYQVLALCAHQQIERLFQQCLAFRPRFAVVRDAALAAILRQRLNDAACATQVEYGAEALVRMASLPEVDVVMAAIVGAAGLPPSLAAANAGKKILLANKEALVMAGPIFMCAVRENAATLLPIDSEHNAIFQSLPANFSDDLSKNGIRSLLLTASGGPFRLSSLADLEHVSAAQACAHPNWAMGQKISVDCATMMNKGLEMIEAHYLFNVPHEKITIVIHPQSVIHSLVQYVDGSVLAELGNPDMRTPIAHALAFPERIESGVADLDLVKIASLHFESPDFVRFPCLSLAYRAVQTGQSAPTSLNAANEIAVAAFLDQKIGFTNIAQVIKRVLDLAPLTPLNNLTDVLKADAIARELAISALCEWQKND